MSGRGRRGGGRSVLDSEPIKDKAHALGFELAGVTRAEPTLESLFYPQWLERGFHGEMGYLEGRRGAMRADARTLMPSARSVVCVGLVYNTDEPYSTELEPGRSGWISRYAWGRDYHRVLKSRLTELGAWMREEYGPGVKCKPCADTSPLLERAYAHRAGLGWIGKNTCLIDERMGSWFFLGEVLTSLDLAPDGPAPFRCGTCRRCIDACPTDALVPVDAEDGPSHALDSRLCIAYWTIELRGSVPAKHRSSVGQHVFGCDICQDVCPWNSPGRAAVTAEPAFQANHAKPDLAELAGLSEQQFNAKFADSPILRSRHEGFLRNVAVAMGNSCNPAFAQILRRLAQSPSRTVREHAHWALDQLPPAGADATGAAAG